MGMMQMSASTDTFSNAAVARTKPVRSLQTASYFAAFVGLGLTIGSFGPTLPGLAAQAGASLGAVRHGLDDGARASGSDAVAFDRRAARARRGGGHARRGRQRPRRARARPRRRPLHERAALLLRRRRAARAHRRRAVGSGRQTPLPGHRPRAVARHGLSAATAEPRPPS